MTHLEQTQQILEAWPAEKAHLEAMIARFDALLAPDREQESKHQQRMAEIKAMYGEAA